jgi:hypothetical protein
MEIRQIVELLTAERDRLNRAIAALGGSVGHRSQSKRITASSTSSVSQPTAAPSKGQRKPMTAAQRKAHSERMKAFWAARRKQK